MLNQQVDEKGQKMNKCIKSSLFSKQRRHTEGSKQQTASFATSRNSLEDQLP